MPLPVRFPSPDLLFIAELTMSREEFALFKPLWHNPNDDAARGVYADWLEERGRLESAALVRSGQVPNGHRS